MGKMKKIAKTPGGTSGAAKKKKKAKGTGARGTAAVEETTARKPFSTVEVFSKPAAMAPLFACFKGADVSGLVVRPRMLTESVEHGRGRGVIRGFTFRKFKDEKARAVLYITMPKGTGGGSFEPTDRLLKPGEQVEFSYTAEVDGADRPIFFLCKGFFLRKSLYVAESPDDPQKPWVGSREVATETLPKNLVVTGDDVIEVRTDTVTAFPNGPGAIRRDVLDRYLTGARLLVIPGGAVWNQKSTQGHFFQNVRDPLEKLVERDTVKAIDQVTLNEFGNLGDISLMIHERLLSGVDHEAVRPMVVKNPNDHLRQINSAVGFLLHFKISDDVKEALMRTFPQKAGKEEDVYLPLFLERVTEAKEKYRVIFRVFPRDLVEERSRKSMERGLKFMPPYALHQGAENHNTYSKLLIAISQRFREDEKPEDEKNKSAKLLSSVQNRISERRHEFVDEKIKSAFSERVAAKKRKDEGS